VEEEEVERLQEGTLTMVEGGDEDALTPTPPESSARRGCMGRGRWDPALGRRPEISARKGGGAEIPGVL
jgi:hypothetical protein